MHTVEVINGFVHKHMNANGRGPGLSYDDLKLIIYALTTIIVILKWFKKHWNTPFGDGGSDDRDYTGGYYIGSQKNNHNDYY